MTQLPGTEMEAPQETAAEASQNMGSQGISGGGSWHPKVLHTAENPQSGEGKRKGQFCTVRRWIQAAKEGKEINANIGKFAGGKVNLKQRKQ